MWQVQSFLAKGGQISLQEARHRQGEKLGLWTDWQYSFPAQGDTSLLANAAVCQEYQWKTTSSLLQTLLVLQKDNTQGKQLVHFVPLGNLSTKHS